MTDRHEEKRKFETVLPDNDKDDADIDKFLS